MKAAKDIYMRTTAYSFFTGLLLLVFVSCKESVFRQVDQGYIHNVHLPMSIDRFAPTEGSEAAEVMIYGDNYSTDTAAINVKVNGMDAQVLGANRKRILVRVPRGAGTGKIVITIAGQHMETATDFLYVPARTVSTMAGAKTSGFADGQGAAAKFNFVTNAGMAVGPDGNIYVADINNHCIRKITPDGTVSTLAGKPGVSGNVNGKGAAALFDHPSGVAVDKDNNVLVADTWNWALRKITPAGDVSTILGWVLPFPHAVAIDNSTGKMYVVGALQVVTKGRLFEVSPTGAMTEHQVGVNLIAGGICIDGKGDLLVPDNGSSVVYRINTTSWESTVVAGLANSTGWMDGIGATARFEHPWGITTDAAGNIYVAGCGHQFDAVPGTSGSNIRMIVPATGKVSTIAGGDAPGFADGPGGAAKFSIPSGIACAKDGKTLYVLDRDNYCIRKIITE